MVVDTEEHRAALPGRYQRRASVVPVGAPAAWFAAARAADGEVVASETDPGPLRVVFYGLYTPLQGTPVIGAALSLLAGTPIEVTMIGDGQDAAAAKAAAAANPAVRWVDWVPAADLPAVVASHDVCLGIFGTGDKGAAGGAEQGVPGAAAGCAIVTSDTAPQRRVLGAAARCRRRPVTGALALARPLLAGDLWSWPGCAGRRARLAAGAVRAWRRWVAPLLGLKKKKKKKKGKGLQPCSMLSAGPGSPAMLAPLTPNAWLR